MAQKKITELTALSGASSDDLLLIVDNPSTTPVSKKITFGDLTSTFITLASTSRLTNKELINPIISTISNSGTLTLPTSTDTLVGRTTTDDLSNKNLISPTMTTPTLGVATATSINKVTITAPASSATLTIANTGSLITSGAYSITLTATNTTTVTLPTTGTLATLAGSETLSSKTLTNPIISSISNTGTLTLPTSTDTLVGKATTDTLTNKRITKRVQSVSDAATVTPNADSDDAVDITAIAQAFTIANPSGTPTNFQTLLIRIKDDGTARAITWGSGYVAGGVSLPSTTILSKILNLGFIYNTANSLNKWQLVASSQEA